MAASAENGTSLSLSARFLGGLVTVVSARPRFTLWLVLAVACAAVGISFDRLTVKTSRTDLVDPAAKFARQWQDYAKTFGATSDLIVAVETDGANPHLIQSVLDELGPRLQQEPQLFSGVLYRIDQRSLRQKGLQFLSETQLQRTAERIDNFNMVVRQQQWDRIRIESLAKELRERIVEAERTGKSPESLYRAADRMAQSLKRFQDLTTSGKDFDSASFISPIPELLTVSAKDGASDSDIAYLMNADSNIGLLQVFPVAQENVLDANSVSIARLRQLMVEVAADFQKVAPDLKISLTGIPVLEHDEMQRSAADMINAALVALVLVSVLLFLGFRGTRHPMLAILTLVVAICCTFGAATLVIGHVNVLSVSFTVILIGLGIEFSIHFLCRYLALRQELYELHDALKITAQTVGTGITMSALTTALAFGSAMLTGFPGLAELGIISAMGVLLCAASTFVFLPALIAMSDADLDPELLPRALPNAWYRRTIVAWPVIVVAVSALGIAGIGSRAFQYSDGSVNCAVNYDANLMNVNDSTLESVMAQKRLFQKSNESLLYAVAVAQSREETLRLRSEFLKLPTVGRVSELASRLPPLPDAGQTRLINRLRSMVTPESATSPRFQRTSVATAGREIDQLYAVLKKSQNVTANHAAQTLDVFLTDLEVFSARSGAKAAAMFDAYQVAIATSLLKEYDKVYRGSHMEAVTARDLPESLRSRFVRADADREYWLLRVYPKQEIWDAKPLEEFVRDVRKVAPDITGIPIQNYESSGMLHHSYRIVGLYSLAVISLFVLFDFLRPGQKLLTILPPIAVVAFIGYSMFRRTGAVNPHLLVGVGLTLTCFIAAVLDYRNLRDTLLAMLPSLGGCVILMGLMVVFGFDLNPVNLIALPLVLGTGVDNGIHLLQDYRRQIAAGKSDYKPSEGTVNGVLLTSMTSAVGFGSLLIASHQGLFSIGVLLAVGITACLGVALIPLPALLALVAKHQPASMEPVRLRQSRSGDGEAESAGKQQQQPKKKAA